MSTDASLDHIPLFVRAGSILPLGEGEVPNTDAQLRLPLTIAVYAGRSASYREIQDDGHTHLWRRGRRLVRTWKWNQKRRELSVVTRGSFEGMLPQRRLRVRVVGIADVQHVVVNGRRIPARRVRRQDGAIEIDLGSRRQRSAIRIRLA